MLTLSWLLRPTRLPPLTPQASSSGILPTSSARTGYAVEGALFMSTHLWMEMTSSLMLSESFVKLVKGLGNETGPTQVRN